MRIKTLVVALSLALLVSACSTGSDSATPDPSDPPTLAEFDLDGDGAVDWEFLDPDGDGIGNEPTGRLAEFLSSQNTDVPVLNAAIDGDLKANLSVWCDPLDAGWPAKPDWDDAWKNKTFNVFQGDKFVIDVYSTGGNASYASICTDAMAFSGYSSSTCGCTNGASGGITYSINYGAPATRSWYTGSRKIYEKYQIVFDFTGVNTGKFGHVMSTGPVVASNFSWGGQNYKSGTSYGSLIFGFWNVKPGPDHLGLDTAPGSASVGVALDTAGPTVSLRDQADAVFVKNGQEITASVLEGSGDGRGSVGGQTSAVTTNGVASFGGLIVNGTVGETYTLVFKSGTLTEVTAEVTIANPGSATILDISRPTSVLVSGRALLSTPIVNAADAGGNIRSDWLGDVSVAISGGDGSGALSGTTTVTSVDGVAEFSDLVIEGTTGETYTLTYSASGLEAATEEVTLEAVNIEIVASIDSHEVGESSVATYSVAGSLLDGDEIGAVEFTFEGSGTTAYGPTTSAPSAVGSYTVTPSSIEFAVGSAAPYAPTFTGVEFEITPVVVTVSVDDIAIRVGEEPEVTNSLSRALLPGDAIDSVAVAFEGSGDTIFASSSTPPTALGSYVVTPTSVTLASGDPSNYVFRFLSGQMSIGTAPLEVIADSVSVRAGASLDIGFSLGTPLLDGDVVESVVLTYEGTGDTTYAASTEVPTAAGTYSVTPSAIVLSSGSLSDYEVTFTPGTLAIGVIPIEIVGGSLTREIGETASVSYEVAGTLIDGDVIDAVTLTYTGTDGTEFEASTVPPEAVGEYSVMPTAVQFSTGSTSDYAITYTAGSLVITAAEPVAGSETTDVAESETTDDEIVPSTEPPPAREVSVGTARFISREADVSVPAVVNAAKVTATSDGVSVSISGEGDADGDDLLEISSSITLQGSGFEAGASVEIWIFSTPTYLGSTTVGADGTFTASVVVPSELVPGDHTVQVQVEEQSVVIPVEKPSYSLPATGYAEDWLRLTSLGSIVIGLMMLLLTRRRHS